MFVPGRKEGEKESKRKREKERKVGAAFFFCECSHGKLTLLGLWVGDWALFLLEDSLLGGLGRCRKDVNYRKK